MSWKCQDQFELKFPLIRNLHRAVNRQPGYPRETRKAKLKILQKKFKKCAKTYRFKLIQDSYMILKSFQIFQFFSLKISDF